MRKLFINIKKKLRATLTKNMIGTKSDLKNLKGFINPIFNESLGLKPEVKKRYE